LRFQKSPKIFINSSTRQTTVVRSGGVVVSYNWQCCFVLLLFLAPPTSISSREFLKWPPLENHMFFIFSFFDIEVIIRNLPLLNCTQSRLRPLVHLHFVLYVFKTIELRLSVCSCLAMAVYRAYVASDVPVNGEITVTHASTGPTKFSIRLKKRNWEYLRMRSELESCTLRPLPGPPVNGTACIAVKSEVIYLLHHIYQFINSFLFFHAPEIASWPCAVLSGAVLPRLPGGYW